MLSVCEEENPAVSRVPWEHPQLGLGDAVCCVQFPFLRVNAGSLLGFACSGRLLVIVWLHLLTTNMVQLLLFPPFYKDVMER